ncbi:hypothetical protein GF351_01030 [Candidatus Woesearchaeota archaeon]|nr:hypothetical protein [Candidatus Woesearchaeota archaeon]
MAEQQKRQIAYKVRIRDLQKGEYVKQEGWNPNYITSQDGRKISRVNIIGAVVSASEPGSFPSIIIDDSTGRISVRTFEEDNDMLGDVRVGEVVMLVGRPREYGNEKYIVPEILRKIQDKRWIDVRRLELGEEAGGPSRQEEKPQEVSSPPEKGLAEETAEAEDKHAEDPIQNLIDCIRSLDKGEGADHEEVIQRCGKDKEEHIKRLLEQGEIFEIRPGMLKVLE